MLRPSSSDPGGWNRDVMVSKNVGKACGLAVREASAANDADAVKKAQGKMDAAKMALKKAQKAAKASKKKDQPKKQKAGGKKKVSGLGLEAKKRGLVLGS